MKGRVEGDYVYGVKNDTNGDCEYEYRYDEGSGDREWMEECDRNYLARLERVGRLQQVEPGVWARKQKAEQGSKEKATREEKKKESEAIAEKAQRAREATEKEEREQKERSDLEAKELVEKR